jgi:beta-ureidopropionase / N-carbamoyl-L-amino-acid hydrolase
LIAVDAGRLRADFEQLASIGRGPDGALQRTTFSGAHFEARAWFAGRVAAAGLELRVDQAGNHSAVLPGRSGASRTLLLGSHLDSVPAGGAYDGALGVVAALETLRAVKDARATLPVTLEAIDFTDEEGALVGLLGSWALAGTLTPEILGSPRGGRERLLAALQRAGLTEQGLYEARRDPETLAGYLELHIEQGPVLEHAQIDIGVVTAIAGSRSYRLVFKGARRHAGTTPIDARRDALVGAAGFALAVRETAAHKFQGCVGTVGAIEVERAAFNVVPGRAALLLELRAPDGEQLDKFEAEVLSAAQREAAGAALELEVEQVGNWDPVALDETMRSAIAGAARSLDLQTRELISGAGHDAQALAAITPAGMIFVPSVGGISHDPGEHTRWEDCVNGANVLLTAALAVARG